MDAIGHEVTGLAFTHIQTAKQRQRIRLPKRRNSNNNYKKLADR